MTETFDSTDPLQVQGAYHRERGAREHVEDSLITMREMTLCYGAHRPDCNWHEANESADCDCGWTQIRGALEGGGKKA